MDPVIRLFSSHHLVVFGVHLTLQVTARVVYNDSLLVEWFHFGLSLLSVDINVQLNLR